ncbi:hypothetical protein [Spirosoma aerophilum]
MNQTTVLNPANLSATIEGCHQDHQYWQQIIRRQEEEISQLRSLLHDVMEQHNYRSLQYDAVDYDQALNHLQSDIKQLRQTMICESTECLNPVRNLTCTNARFGISTTIERHTTKVINDFSRVKDGCLQFLSGMMSLNLL